jgi:hypothetical protein
VSPASTIAVYRWRLLVDESPVQNDSFGRGNTSINGTAYRNSIGLAARGSGRRVEYNLRRKCVEYRAVIGLMDDSEADATADVRVDVDGTPLFNQRLSLTTVRAVRLNTRGWLRLTLRASSNVGIFGSQPVVSFAESKIRCLF